MFNLEVYCAQKTNKNATNQQQEVEEGRYCSKLKCVVLNCDDKKPHESVLK